MRRNPQPAQRGTRPPQGKRPSGPQQRRPQKRKAQPKFFVFLGLLILIVLVAIFLIVRMRKPSGPAVPEMPTITAVPITTASPDSSVNLDATEEPAQTDANGEASYDELAALLGTDDGAAALDDSKRIQVADLSMNQDLPSEWMNVLLLGTDERVLAEKGRTDSMIICSVNVNTGEVKLSSIMRDLAIDYKAMGYNELGTYRVNAANFFGGPEMAMQTVNYNFGLNIQKYVLVNFFGFQDAVDAVGGITMDITEAEMNKINQAQKQVYGIGKNVGLDVNSWKNELLTEYGENVHLNGQQALGYARIRKLDSDYARSERQRKVLVAVLNEVKGLGAMELAQLGTTLMSYIQTNMTLNEILNIAVKVLASDMEVESLRLPVNGSYVEERRNDDAMLWDCDFDMNKQQLYDFIYN